MKPALIASSLLLSLLVLIPCSFAGEALPATASVSPANVVPPAAQAPSATGSAPDLQACLASQPAARGLTPVKPIFLSICLTCIQRGRNCCIDEQARRQFCC
jgi:hypothetical protein